MSQVSAPDEHDAVLAWAGALRTERPFGRASSYLAKAAEADLADYPPVAIKGVSNVWCVTGSCGSDLMLADIVETVAPANVRFPPKSRRWGSACGSNPCRLLNTCQNVPLKPQKCVGRHVGALFVRSVENGAFAPFSA